MKQAEVPSILVAVVLLVLGVTAEPRKIQNEVSKRIKLVASAVKTGQNSTTLRSLADEVEVARNRIKGGQQNNRG